MLSQNQLPIYLFWLRLINIWFRDSLQQLPSNRFIAVKLVCFESRSMLSNQSQLTPWGNLNKKH